jgi:paraquat-inducible protein B
VQDSLAGSIATCSTTPPAAAQRRADHAELQRAAQSLRTLGDYLQRHPEAILRGKRADPPLESGEKRR